MEAECNDTGRVKPLEYKQLIWGDLIYGTKAELQAIGLGIGMAFPGEPGGPKRLLNVLDPRGFSTKIDRGWDGIRYCARIPFPGRHHPENPWVEVAPGLKKREGLWCDKFIGSPEALAAAGLVRVDQLPGQPGMRKVRVTIFPDGSVAGGAPTSNRREARMPGAKSIERASKTTYSVTISIPKDECQKRSDSDLRATRDYESRMQALRRPAPLMAGIEDEREAERVAAAAKRETERKTRVDGIRAECTLFSMVNSAAEYRKKMIDELRSSVRHVRDRDMLPNDNHGFSMGESASAELDELLDQMIELIADAAVQFDAGRQKEIVRKANAAVAKGDTSFQRTMARLHDSVGAELVEGDAK